MYTQAAGGIVHDRARDQSGNLLDFEYRTESHGTTPLLVTGWGPRPNGGGFQKGFAAINRPTNVGAGNSLRGYIEICNQLGADLWWSHPWPVVAVGTRNAGANFQNGNVTFAWQRGESASNPNQVGRILVDHEYVDGFVSEVETHLRPDLKVYSEWVNEVWNATSAYIVATRIAWAYAFRAIAEERYGGDGGIWFRNGALQSPAINAGAPLGADANVSMAAFSAAASAALAEALRDRLGSSSREIVAVAAGQSNRLDRSARGLGQLWSAMPGLFKHLDAVAHAPYRNPFFSDPPVALDYGSIPNNRFASFRSAAEAWDWFEEVWNGLTPYATNGQLNTTSFWTTARNRDNNADLNLGHFRSWKHLAIDEPINSASPASSYTRMNMPPGWPANKRRWNLQLVTYEGGNHWLPTSEAGKLLTYGFVMEPRFAAFNERYMETIFAPGPRGLARNPSSSQEEALYRPGMVPDGIEPAGEPLHSLFTFLISMQEPSYRHGHFWSHQWWNGQQLAPQVEGIRNAVLIGSSQWWNEENEE
jgi:hypothetical protein